MRTGGGHRGVREPVQVNAGVIGRLDCLLCFAGVAGQHGYTRPRSMIRMLWISRGRHPVIEQQLPPGEEYVANDVFLDTEPANPDDHRDRICQVNPPC
jgi:DNA mismatch repair ATPase MutS